MEKRRTFKRTKPPTAPEKKGAKKAEPAKKPVVKKVVAPVKPHKPEPVKSHPLQKEVVSRKPEPEEVITAAMTEVEITESPVRETSEIEHTHMSDSNNDSDVVVVTETTVSEVITGNNSSRPHFQDEQSLTETEAATRKSVAFIWVLLGIFVIFLAGGLAFAFLFQHPQQPEQVYTAPTDTPAPIKPEAPAAAQWKIEVLNGSGVPGAAAKVASRLELLGYTILKTGNTDATPAKTTFYLSKEFSPYADDFVSSLAKEKITAVNGGELTGSTASAQIIIGAE